MTDQFDLTDDQREIQELARRFTADRITPFAAEWDEKHIFPRDTIKAAAELGFASIYVSEESGGINLGRLEAALIMEAMAYGCPSTSAFISIHNMASWMIDRFGGQAVKDRYLPSLVTMDRIASYCLTEPGSGSDAAALKTRAVRDGDHYIVNGTKLWTSWAHMANKIFCLVRTSADGPKQAGISFLLIDMEQPGVTISPILTLGGMHAVNEVQITDVRVPVANLLGQEGDAWTITKFLLGHERLDTTAHYVQVATGLLREVISPLEATRNPARNPAPGQPERTS